MRLNIPIQVITRKNLLSDGFKTYIVLVKKYFVSGKTKEQQDTFDFYFRGCGWKTKQVLWSTDDQRWIRLMDKLMSLMFGEDFLQYSFDKKKTCYVHSDFQPQFVYRREEWISEFDDMLCSDRLTIPTTSNAMGKSTLQDL